MTEFVIENGWNVSVWYKSDLPQCLRFSRNRAESRPADAGRNGTRAQRKPCCGPGPWSATFSPIFLKKNSAIVATGCIGNWLDPTFGSMDVAMARTGTMIIRHHGAN
jgi:hypothetical protein